MNISMHTGATENFFAAFDNYKKIMMIYSSKIQKNSHTFIKK